jgi:glycosyltransferase involved in cell wall biosynthesis
VSIGTFCLVKNESPWIGAHLLQILPYIDEVVLFDGGSTDGTLEIIKAIQRGNGDGKKIKLFEDKDPKDLQDDYVRLFDECMRSLSTDLAWFLHPDMFVVNPEKILAVRESRAISLTTKIRSFAGEPGGQLYEIKGRGEAWKNIYRLRSPDLGAHYFGHYGAHNEDVYFRAITGDSHEHYGQDFQFYPYGVDESGLEVLHFSDVRPRARRVDRMVKCFKNNGYSEEVARARTEAHPRVTLKDGDGLKFVPSQYPQDFIDADMMYARLRKEPACA